MARENTASPRGMLWNARFCELSDLMLVSDRFCRSHDDDPPIIIFVRATYSLKCYMMRGNLKFARGRAARGYERRVRKMFMNLKALELQQKESPCNITENMLPAKNVSNVNEERLAKRGASKTAARRARGTDR